MIYVGVIGSSECNNDLADLAYRAGKAVAAEGAVLVCGGLGGVMHHACRGAKEEGGVTIGILPTGDRRHANPYVDHAIPTALGEARNSIVVRTADAVAAIGGSYGTLSEMAFALRLEKPLAGVKTWRMSPGGYGNASHPPPPVEYFEDPAAAIRHVLSALKSMQGRLRQ